MEYKYNNLKRIFRRAVEELYSTYIVSRDTSFVNYIDIINAKILNHKLNRSYIAENEKSISCLMKKHNILMEYFEKRYKKFIDAYEFDENSIPKSSIYKNKIWICWWQGIENAPNLIKKCVNSIRVNVAPYDVIILDETNYRDYANIPDWIEQKKKQGIITLTHFSDFLRIELLAEHGGVWLDSTFFANDFDVTKIMNLPVWSIKRPGYGHLSVACGDFANYSFGCNFENRKVFSIIRDYLAEYWRTNNIMIDYLFLDYLIELALRHNSYIKNMFDQIPNNNPKCDELQKVLGKEYNDDKWKELTKYTHLFKLSWKRDYPIAINCKDTFYGRILNETL